MPGRFLGLFLFAAALFFCAGAAYAQTVIVTPGSVTATPGQTVSLAARTTGLPGRPGLRWILRGPRVPGADWGRLQPAGNTATYTPPSRPPPGAIVIQVQALGQYGQPVASAQVPVRILTARPGPRVAPPTPFPPPVVTAPPRPPRVLPPPPRPSVPPGIPSAPTAPPRTAAPLPVPPPSASPAGAQPSQAARFALQAQARCRTRQSGAAYLAQAETLWSGLNTGQRLQAVDAFARAQLGPSVPLSVRAPDRRIRNVARVTGAARGVSVTFGTAGLATSQSVLDEPLTRPASLGWSYASLLDFLCYENEVARIRHQLGPNCLAMYDRVKAQLDGTQAYAANAADPAQARAQIASYQRFMASVPTRYGTSQSARMAASWLFERIAVERGRGAKTCDMPLSAGGPAYDTAIAKGLQFEHDTLAARLGRAFCSCPR